MIEWTQKLFVTINEVNRNTKEWNIIIIKKHTETDYNCYFALSKDTNNIVVFHSVNKSINKTIISNIFPSHQQHQVRKVVVLLHLLYLFGSSYL